MSKPVWPSVRPRVLGGRCDKAFFKLETAGRWQEGHAKQSGGGDMRCPNYPDRPPEEGPPQGACICGGKGVSYQLLLPVPISRVAPPCPSQSTDPCLRCCFSSPHSLPGLPDSSPKDHSLFREGFLILTVPLSCSNPSYGSAGSPDKVPTTKHGSETQSHLAPIPSLAPALPPTCLPSSCMCSFGISGECVRNAAPSV